MRTSSFACSRWGCSAPRCCGFRIGSAPRRTPTRSHVASSTSRCAVYRRLRSTVMSRVVLCATLLAAVTAAACSEGTAKTTDTAAAQLAVAVSPVAATEQPIARFIRVTGTLTAEEQADVAAETAGRVVATPVERGTAVTQGAELVKLSTVETEASLKEAEANAAQIEARLALGENGYDVNRVPEVANARANFDLASSEFGRIQ